jgi:hypothetical protein
VLANASARRRDLASPAAYLRFQWSCHLPLNQAINAANLIGLPSEFHIFERGATRHGLRHLLNKLC